MKGLPPGHVDLWWVSLDGFDDSDSALSLRLLSPGELARYNAFKVQSARTQFLAARALLRSTLSRYRAIPPKRWRFRKNAFGRPLIDEGLGVRDLHFSVTHTDGLVSCAVGRFPEIGVDAECRHRRIPIPDLTATVLAPQEKAQLDELTDEASEECFLALWTLKEAYVKARGMGLSLPMNAICFNLDVNAASVRFTDEIADDPSRWMFHRFRPTSRHLLSLAAAPVVRRLEVVLRRTSLSNLPNDF